MKNVLKVLALIGFLGLASCSDDLEQIKSQEPTEHSDPDTDDDDCKGNCPDQG